MGRAGRFNTAGIAITFASNEEERKVLKDIEEKYKITINEFPSKIEENELCEIKRSVIMVIYQYGFKEVLWRFTG